MLSPLARATFSVLTCQSTNLVIILVMMQVSKKIAFEDPQVLQIVRAGYIVSNVIIAAIYYYVYLQIIKKKGECAAKTIQGGAANAW
jgi:uncharacterized membrane protein